MVSVYLLPSVWNKKYIPLPIIPSKEFTLLHPPSLFTAEANPRLLALQTIYLRNKVHLPRVRIQLEDLRGIRVPESGDDLVEVFVVVDGDGSVTQAVGGEFQQVRGLCLFRRRHDENEGVDSIQSMAGRARFTGEGTTAGVIRGGANCCAVRACPTGPTGTSSFASISRAMSSVCRNMTDATHSNGIYQA